MDCNLISCLFEGPSDPMCLGAIGRVETDEELLSSRCITEWDWRNSVFLVPVDDRSFSSPRECLDDPNQVWFGISLSPVDRAARPGRTCAGPGEDWRGSRNPSQR